MEKASWPADEKENAKMKNENLKQAAKAFLALIITVAGIAAAAYFGLWVMFIKAILTACIAFDAGALTGMLIGWTIIKCMLASTVAYLIISATKAIVSRLCK